LVDVGQTVQAYIGSLKIGDTGASPAWVCGVVEPEADPEAVAKGGGALQGSGNGSLQRGPGAEPLVGLGGKTAQNGIWWCSPEMLDIF